MFDLSECKRDADGNYLAQTCDGRPVTLITTKGREPWPLVGYIEDGTNPWSWKADGKATQEQDDLINNPEPKRSGRVWVQVWLGLDGDLCCSARFNKPSRETGLPNLAVKCVPWTEGEGLEGK